MEALFDPADLVRIAERLGATLAEVMVVGGSYKYVEARNNKVERVAQDSITTMGVRVVVDGSIGAAGGEVATIDDARKLVERALAIARAKEDGWPGFNDKVSRGPEVSVYDNKTASMTVEEVAGLLREQISTITGMRNITVSTAATEVEVVRVSYANSHGGSVEEAYTTFSYGYELSARTEYGEGTYSDYIVRSRYEPRRVEDLTSRGIRRVLDAARARPGETVKTTLILDPPEAASIIDIMLSPAISAEQVQEGRSPLAGKVGSLIFSPRLVVLDDPTLPWEPGSRSFDAEGHPTYKKAIVDKGVLKTFLYDYYTAVREGVESTGNAQRRMPWSKTSPAPTNLVVEVEGSKVSLDKLVAGIDGGVLVVSTIGAWMSNPVSGNVNATATLAYMIRKGSIEEPVKGLTWGDDFYEALRGRLLDAGGLECREGVCAPAIAISDTILAGR